jgi:general secretion pathway protein G
MAAPQSARPERAYMTLFNSIANRKYGRERGFTLIEIMVVVVIIGILATIIAPKIFDKPDQARVVKAQTDIKAIMAALNLYRLDHFKYPTADEGLQALVTPPAEPGANTNAPATSYLDKAPVDPWQHPYQYLNPGVHGEIDVMSYGRDGQPGGEGYDADIGSWEI